MVKYWFKNAIIYSTHVETFMDSNGDGIGDFRGMTRSLDYLSGLGINCIWLLPFFSSPNRDHGYDVSDYLNVDPRFGTLGHFVEFLEEAEERGIRVILDLVINHTSIDHPWFQQARKDKQSKYRQYYIWADEKPKHQEEQVIFGHHQDGNWEYEPAAGQFYYHTFYKHQADLNLSNPDVQEEIRYILHFWMKLGIAGFRMDAVPHMLREKGNVKLSGNPFQFLKDLRSFVEDQRKDAILLAEVDTDPKHYQDYFGNSDQVHMLFNFYLNNHIFLALARKNAVPIIEVLKELPQTTMKEQMGVFLRNHDELDLERLSESERQEVFSAFGPSKEMQIYDRGIRRRLAPMLNNNRQWMELAYSLLFSLPGTPVLRYGQEIGMGDDLSLPERNSVRTAMQWSGEKHGGFSLSPQRKIPIPVISSGEYGYERVNVHQQMRDPNSFLNWIERIISVRKECIEFGYGNYEILTSTKDCVLAHVSHHNHGRAFAVHNLSDQECTFSLDVKENFFDHMIECFSDRPYGEMPSRNAGFVLSPFGYRWFRKSPLFL